MPTGETSRTPADVAKDSFDGLLVKDVDELLTYYADDAVEDLIAGETLTGHQGIRRFFEELFAAFPDFDAEVERIVADDTTAVVQWHWQGTFSGGRFQNMDPTGRRMALRMVDVMSIEGGLIRQNTVYFDGVSIARQVGFLPDPGSTADRAIQSIFTVKTRLGQSVRGALKGSQ